MLKLIVVLLVVAIAALIFIIMRRPDSFRIARTGLIGASPDKVFALLDDFHQWAKWSPWEELDPSMTRTFSGADKGVGAVYAWTGNKKVGEGRMEITSAEPGARLQLKLDFLKPWKASNTTDFILKPKSGGTEVTWAMMGPSPFMFKAMGLFMNMDQVVGKDFEKGLARMKTAAEAQ